MLPVFLRHVAVFLFVVMTTAWFGMSHVSMVHAASSESMHQDTHMVDEQPTNCQDCVPQAATCVEKCLRHATASGRTIIASPPQSPRFVLVDLGFVQIVDPRPTPHFRRFSQQKLRQRVSQLSVQKRE